MSTEERMLYFGTDLTIVSSLVNYFSDDIDSVLVNVIVNFISKLEEREFDILSRREYETLEEIGNSYEGVEKTYAMQAGREVRVMVKPDEIDDAKSYQIAREMKEKIEKEMQYPGTIKITVIRETRAQEEAK